jgi:hypothetical protein
MTLSNRAGQTYGDTQADIPERLRHYSRKNGYPAEHFADAMCRCSNRTFTLLVDDTEGAAIRKCIACGHEHPIGDGDEYLEGAELEECGCPCGAEGLELTVGVALYTGSQDVRWLYIGARCPHCGLVGCYADWKDEFLGYRELLSRV